MRLSAREIRFYRRTPAVHVDLLETDRYILTDVLPSLLVCLHGSVESFMSKVSSLTAVTSQAV